MSDTTLLFLEDSYAKEADANVIEILPEGVVLDRTIFYYISGGQPCDVGELICADNTYLVNEVRKKDGKLIHFIDGENALVIGDEVHLKIDWEHRYTLMKMHTAAHVLASIMYKKEKILVTGNQLGVDKTRFDFNMEQFDKEFMQNCINEANAALLCGHEIKSYTLPREEALNIEGVSKLANVLPPQLKLIRLVQIGDIDVQADGGTHVKNTREVGQIELIKCDNRGKANRRVYFKLKN